MIDNYKESKLVPCLIATSLLPGTSQSQAGPQKTTVGCGTGCRPAVRCPESEFVVE